MALTDIGINKAVASRIQNSILSGKIVHAYIFEGDNQIDKMLLAKTFVKALLCEKERGIGCGICPICQRIDHDNYEDIFYPTLSEKGNMTDAAIEELQAKIKIKPLEGERNIAIISNADKMTQRAQNRLLKTLEEPPGNAIIILLVENTENLLQTIRSRCVIYRTNDYSIKQKGEMGEYAQDIADMLIAKKPFYEFSLKLGEILSDKENSRDLARQFLDSLEYVYRDLLIEKSPKSRLYKKEYIYNAVESIEKAKRALNQNANIGYLLKGLMLEIGG